MSATIDTSESNGLLKDFIRISQIFGLFNCGDAESCVLESLPSDKDT